MEVRARRWLPATLFGAALALELVAVPLSWRLEPAWDTLLYAVFSVVGAGAGALIAHRHPRNAIGWLLLGSSLVTALLADVAQGYALRGAVEGWPVVPAAEWLVTTNWLTGGVAWPLIFLLFPDGRPPGPRWRVVGWLAVVGAAVALPGWVLSGTIDEEFSSGVNPYVVDALPSALLQAVGLTLFVGSLVAAGVALVQRLRRARGVERQQLVWFVSAAALAATVLAVSPLLWYRIPVVRPLAAVVLTLLPLTAAVAILRYRLYDIDLVVNRTVVYLALTVLLAAAYVASAAALGAGVGRDSAWVAAGATLVVAGAARPLRGRVQREVDRRFPSPRYVAVRRIERFLDDLCAGRAAPEEVGGALREALGDPSLELLYKLPGHDGEVDGAGVPVVSGDGEGLERWPILRAGAVLGVAVRQSGTPRQRALVPVLLTAAGLGVEMARLRVELRRQLDELAASRARIVAATEAELRRIERDLHDGAQQRLVSIGLALRHAQHQLGPEAAGAHRTLDGAVAEIAVAIDELRELALGLRPAQLDAGLGPALRELAQRAPLRVEVDATGHRFGSELETAAYFVACEGLTNAVKHARATKVTVDVAREGTTLVVRVADDGVGGARLGAGSGLTGLSDRVAAHGGALHIASPAGAGTTLIVELPCAS